MVLLTILLMALATWRLANMLADTEQHGPFELLDRFRSLSGVGFNQMGNAYPENQFAEGLLCVYCNSVWIGTGMMLLLYFFPVFVFYFSLPFALSALAIFAEKVEKR